MPSRGIPRIFPFMIKMHFPIVGKIHNIVTLYNSFKLTCSFTPTSWFLIKDFKGYWISRIMDNLFVLEMG